MGPHHLAQKAQARMDLQNISMATSLGIVTTEQAESMRLRVIDQFGDAISATPLLDPPPPFTATFLPDLVVGEDDDRDGSTHPAATPYCGPVAKSDVLADYAGDPNADTVAASLEELDAQAAREDATDPQRPDRFEPM